MSYVDPLRQKTKKKKKRETIFFPFFPVLFVNLARSLTILHTAQVPTYSLSFFFFVFTDHYVFTVNLE